MISRGRTASFAALLLLVAATAAIVLVPAWLIRPFAPQTPRDLEISYALRRGAPVAAPLLALPVVLLAARLWPGARGGWRRMALALAVILAFAAAWLSRQNHFEWFFHPLSRASFAPAGDAPFLEEGDMVLAVEVNGEAAAYPVRQMAYHHVVQDRVGGVPLVATY